MRPALPTPRVPELLGQVPGFEVHGDQPPWLDPAAETTFVMQAGLYTQIALAIAQPHLMTPLAAAPAEGIRLQELAQHGTASTGSSAAHAVALPVLEIQQQLELVLADKKVCS